MTVRAKFKVDSITSTIYNRQKAYVGRGPEPGQSVEYENVEMRTISLRPVYSTDPNSENKRFWDASPTGEIKLGTINPEAWQAFELGQEYYIDFTKANE